MNLIEDIKKYCIQASFVCIILIILIGGVKMKQKIYAFKEDGCKVEIYSKKDFAVVTGTLTEGTMAYEASVNLPEGFTSTNCVIISAMAQNPTDEATWGIGTVLDSAGYIAGSVPLMARMTDNLLEVRMRNINFASEGDEQTAYIGKGAQYNFKVVLMKI